MIGWIGHWNQSQERDSEKFVKMGTVGSGNRTGRGRQTREGALEWRWGRGEERSLGVSKG